MNVLIKKNMNYILTLVIYNGIISTINKKKEHIECKVKK